MQKYLDFYVAKHPTKEKILRLSMQYPRFNMDYRTAKSFIINELRQDLSPLLHYHGLHHTLDVLRMSTHICEQEGVRGYDLTLVKTAALYHDAGFLKNVHNGHELEGCLIVKKHLPDFGYSEAALETICSMIMATKIPQSPKNLLEKIICDADLDYLGRQDFYQIGNTLFEELQAYKLIGDIESWNKVQVSFLASHHFHTHTNKLLRDPVKHQYIEELKKLVANY